MDGNPSTAGRCFHCGAPLNAAHSDAIVIDGERKPVCCAGCAAAAGAILAQGLGRFYQFRNPPLTAPVPAGRDWTVFDRAAALARYTHVRADGSRELGVQLDGLHCAACVWLIENSLQRHKGILAVNVNLGEERAQIRYDPEQLPLSRVLRRLEQIGYRPQPISYLSGAAAQRDERRVELQRLAVAGFGMMQVMSFAAALYAGAMDGIAPDLERLLRYVSMLVATPVVLYSAQPFFVAAWHTLRARSLGMDVPVALSIGIAYLWSVWATLIDHGKVYFDSAVMFTFLLLLGRYVERSLRHRASLRIESLHRLLPESVLRITAADAERVTADELQAGDRIRVLTGERVPADGPVLTGLAEIDEALLTGEATPRVCRPGDQLAAGTINVNGTVEMHVARVGQDSTLAAVARLVDRAQAVRPPIAELADRVAGRFVGVIVLLALGAGLYWWHRDPTQALSIALTVLVVTCPCALSLATPAALAATTTRLSRAGLLVARSRGLERLARVDTVIFDKTGTLTRGQPRIERIELLQSQLGQEQCLAIATALEAYSTHPVARAFGEHRGPLRATDVITVPARGIEGEIGGIRYRIGQPEYVQEGLESAQRSLTVNAEDGHSVVMLGDRARVLAAFLLADALRPDVVHTVRRLQELGLTVQIASGDRDSVVQRCARTLHTSQARGAMSAADKLKLLRGLQARGHRILAVGDGINDAAVLAAADASIAVGSGADLAQVNADMVLMGEGLAVLPESVVATRRMLRIMGQNLVWAALYNFAAVPLALSGWLQPWMAAVGMSLSSLLVVLNALRLLPRLSAPLSARAQECVVAG